MHFCRLWALYAQSMTKLTETIINFMFLNLNWKQNMSTKRWNTLTDSITAVGDQICRANKKNTYSEKKLYSQWYSILILLARQLTHSNSNHNNSWVHSHSLILSLFLFIFNFGSIFSFSFKRKIVCHIRISFNFWLDRCTIETEHMNSLHSYQCLFHSIEDWSYR